MTGHFQYWNSYCRSPIATTDFDGAVSHLFDPTFPGSFPIWPINCLICIKSTFFTVILFNIFLTKYCYPLPVILSPTPLKSKAEHHLHELHVQTILYKCLAKDNNWSLRVQCMTTNYILLLRFYISQQRQDWSVKLYMKWTQSSD